MLDNQNQSQIQGNFNIVIQGGSGNNITLQTMNISQILELLHPHSEEVQVLIMTLSLQELENINQLTNLSDSLKRRYGSSQSDWSPFTNQEGIISLMDLFKTETGFDLNIFYIEVPDITVTEIDGNLKDFLETQKHKTVLVMDSLALYHSIKSKIAKEFDGISIGGLLAITSITNEAEMSIQREVNTRLLATFDKLHGLVYCYCDKLKLMRGNGLVQVEFEVLDKACLFRRLTNIITKHLGKKITGRVNNVTSDVRKYFSTVTPLLGPT